MKKYAIFALLIIVICSIGIVAKAAVPQYINYQGVLRDTNGNLLDGTYNMSFKFFTASSGGSQVGSTINMSNVSVSDGLFSVMVGPVAASVFDGSDRWIEVIVGTETLSPRLRVGSVAYAVRSANADNSNTVNNIPANSSPTAGSLYPLDSEGKLSGVRVSTEASSATGISLFIGQGKLVIGSGSIVGTDTVPNGASVQPVSNPAVTTSSLVFVTGGPQDWDPGSIYVSDISPGQFTVKIANTAPAVVGYKFMYLIIN